MALMLLAIISIFLLPSAAVAEAEESRVDVDHGRNVAWLWADSIRWTTTCRPTL